MHSHQPLAAPAGSLLFEHRFWLQILGDHSRFILDALSPRETEDIRRANQFIRRFDQLLDQARQASSESQALAIAADAHAATMELKDFKLDLLRRSLLRQVTVHLPPTFFNHMLNELQEYVYILDAVRAGKAVPLFDSLHYDLVWLSDASGHASAIASNLDAVERRLIEKSREFEKHFDDYYKKAVEMVGYLRTQLRRFPAMERFHRDVNLEIKLFTKFLLELEEMDLSAETLDVISPLMPDHMAREECYYLIKLALTGAVPSPECDPTTPRVQG
ncbi:DUF2935 domain-containing protein [Paenibacillus thiaminolyticus]|uniref:DUF2935 domain-containing protein n=1 Tax=Paenibacillus thiaminolyticus TaxID=49283 RepID=UPI001162CD13|nr:DUF2935 domain-containing protein [Paenibacillus thiaminolyticus]MDG0876374.1 DUF2935 domain-containing protein [Paenibacillus thiaminolyticus]NGP58924.1 DUF2935 domain-containing protein [Paenibacillus thiaminolyticus]WCR28901.1 DUF2935 domain-containing protein [Paenibacillus thiaminolyticus]